jgi:type IV secretory pathway VirB6-like protein
MMCIGPIFIPFLVFEPFAQVGWNWIRSMILYPFACIIGSIVSTLLINTNTLKFAVKAGQQASLFTVLTASSVLILMNVMVVSIAHSLVGGSSPSARGAGRTLAAGAQTFSNFGKGFTQIGAGTAGVAVSWGVKGASKAASAAGMSKLSNQMSGFGKTLNSNSQIAFKDGFKQPLWGSATNSGKGSNQAGPKTMNSNQGKRA